MSKAIVNPPASVAKLNAVMVSPVRARLVADLVRGKSLELAYRTLSFEKVKTATIMLKLLRSAMANAQQKGVVDLDRLFISELTVDEGPRVKRFMPRAQGRADQINKRSSHITIKLSEKKGNVEKVAKATKTSKTKTAKAKDGDK